MFQYTAHGNSVAYTAHHTEIGQKHRRKKIAAIKLDTQTLSCDTADCSKLAMVQTENSIVLSVCHQATLLQSNTDPGLPRLVVDQNLPAYNDLGINTVTSIQH